MDDLMNRLQMVVSSVDVDRNHVSRDYGMNPYRRMLQDVMLERKDMLRSKMNLAALFESEEQSPEIEEILAQFTNPTFPLEEINTEKEEEWQPLERKYLDSLNTIKEDMMSKEMQLDKELRNAIIRSDEVLRGHRDIRPIDEKDFCNARQSVTKRFEQAKMSLRGEAATKILMLRREIEQQGRKRRNFDKNTTDILQAWFFEHRSNPYPSDQEKTELAKLCNIKVSQVNNWFGNQRIRSKQQDLRKQEEKAMTVHMMGDHHMNSGHLLDNSGVHNLQPAMSTLVIPQTIHHNVIGNQNGFLPQGQFFQTGVPMQHMDATGQQFYSDFETFGLVPPEADHFNSMHYLS